MKKFYHYIRKKFRGRFFLFLFIIFTNQTIHATSFETNLVTNGDGESLSGWNLTNGPTFVSYTASPASPDGGKAFDFYTGSSTPQTEWISQTIDISDIASNISSGNVKAILNGYVFRFTSGAISRIKLEQLNASDGILATSQDENNGTNIWQQKTITINNLNTSTRKLRITLYGSLTSTMNDYVEFDGIDLKLSLLAASVPTVTTTAASSISTTSATLGGNVTSDGGAAVTERGVVYSTTDDTPTIGEAGVTKDANGSGTGAFFESIGSLDVNTTYYYNAYATNSEGTSYGIASSFTTLKLSQTITFGALPVKTYGDADFAPGATASSGLTVTYSSSNTAVATIVSGQIHIAGAGSCTIYADQAGNDTYYAASQESQSLTINKATPTVTAWPTAAGITYGDDLSSAALSGGTASVAGSFAYDDNTIIPELGVYNAALTFTPTDAGNYNTVSGNINVTVYNLATVTTIAATELAAKTVTINGIVNANNASTDVTFEYGLTTSYGTTIAAVQSPVEGTTNTDVNADISGLTPNTTYHYRVVGINTVGTSNGDDQTFTTSKYDQVITFAELPDKTTNDPDFDAGATSDLGLDVAYASSNEQVATIVSGLIHIVGAGTTDITASQEGNDTVNVAIPVIQSLTVTQATGLESKEYTEFKMYPNPVRDYLSIDIGNQNVSNVEISIIDISGKIVHSKNYNNTVNTIDVSNYNSGLYFVEVKTANAIQKLKLLIE